MKTKTLEAYDFDGDIAVDISNLNLFYSKFQALKDINAQIPRGKITAFIGPSGCGKSTLLKTLNRMNDLVEGCKITGNVNICGRDIYSDGADLASLRKNVGMVFQKPNPFPMSVYDNITYGAKTFGIKSHAVLDQIVESTLRSAAMWDELKDRLTKSALSLSGGQQQRIAIARALVNSPSLIFADEPTGALDSETSREIMELLKSLNEQGKTVIMVTHDNDLVKYSTKVV
ncbi:MAG: phosphate ABC transporter ATP-binding protein, partial [Clostridia bacterium]